MTVLAKLEVMSVGPHVGRVVRHVNGQIAHDEDAAVLAGVPERIELRVEEILLRAIAIDLPGEPLPPAFERAIIVTGGSRFPRGPRRTAVRILEGHEERIVVEP
jgi:hypothetical protein